MSGHTARQSKSAKAAKRRAGAKGGAEQASSKHPHAGRETVESIVIAVILAFLFRTFVAEAFVIPTGSMAPTLQGRHIDVACRACGLRYRTGASLENDSSEYHVGRVVCPNCGRPRKLNWEGVFSNERSFNGDRILVSKFSYDLYEPSRWEVVVFKFPGNAKQNYIKRLVCLPNELVKVWRGNVYVSPTLLKTADLSSKDALEAGRVDQPLRDAFGEAGVELGAAPVVPPIDDIALSTREPHGGWARRIVDGDQQYIVGEHEGRLHVFRSRFQVLRKPPRKLLAMLQIVHDSKYVSDELHDAGWPLRWLPAPRGAWDSDDNGRSYRTNGQAGRAGDVAWLRYRHLQPTDEDWEAVLEGKTIELPDDQPGELITDYYAYNHNAYRRSGNPFHWVGDLAVEADVESLDGQGAVHLELVRAGRKYRCRFDLQSGEAVLSIDDGKASFSDAQGNPAPHPTASGGARGGGRHRLRMSNVDDQLRVWADGRLLEFDAPTTYEPTEDDAPRWSPADPGDTQPLAIGAEGAELEVKRLKVLRDVYYVAKDARGGPEHDFDLGSLNPYNPQQWNNGSLFANRRSILFVLGEQQYFTMGDNSPFSQDARRWSDRSKAYVPPHYVHENLLTGKALLIYWPHHWRWPPFLPNFPRMGLIR